MKALEKIRNLSEGKRKLILWSSVIIIGVILLFFYAKNIRQKIQEFKGEDLKEQLKIPELREELNKLPKIELPQLPEILNATTTLP